MKGLIFTYLMAYGGSLISLFKPYYGFLIYVAFSSLKPEALWWFSVPRGNYSRTIAIAFLIGWVLNGGGNWKFGRAWPTIYIMLLYWAWLLLGAATTPPAAQQAAWFTFDLLSKVFIPLLVGLTLINTMEQVKQLAWVLVLSHGYLAFEFNQTYYSYGINYNDWTFASLDNNGIALTMSTALGIAFFVGITCTVWWQKAIAFLSAAFMAHVVLFSMSRGGMLAMLITGAISFIVIPKKPIHYITLLLACAVVMRLAGKEVQEEFFSAFADKEHLDNSAQSRFDITRDSLKCMLANPIFGCGMENWVNVAPEYGWPQGKRAHNTWAETGATLGIPGFVLIISFYASNCWRLLLLLRDKARYSDVWARGMANAVIAAIAGFFLSAALLTVDRVELPYYIILIGAGVLKVQAQAREPVPAANSSTTINFDHHSSIFTTTAPLTAR